MKLKLYYKNNTFVIMMLYMVLDIAFRNKRNSNKMGYSIINQLLFHILLKGVEDNMMLFKIFLV